MEDAALQGRGRYGLTAVLTKWVEADCRESPADIAEIIKLNVGYALNE